jgi:hypothetical protein
MPDKPAPADASVPATACLEEFAVTHAESVLQEQRRVGPAAPDFQQKFAAAAIDASTYQAVKAVERFRVGGSPILFFTPDRKTAVVDAKVFGDLDAVDPLKMSPGQGAKVGKVLASAQALPRREVARFLILAGIVRVYWHVEASVCFKSETSGPDGYRLRVTGEHTYFTNKRHRERFDFEIGVSTDGSITVSLPKG